MRLSEKSKQFLAIALSVKHKVLLMNGLAVRSMHCHVTLGTFHFLCPIGAERKHGGSKLIPSRFRGSQ